MSSLLVFQQLLRVKVKEQPYLNHSSLIELSFDPSIILTSSLNSHQLLRKLGKISLKLLLAVQTLELRSFFTRCSGPTFVVDVATKLVAQVISLVVLHTDSTQFMVRIALAELQHPFVSEFLRNSLNVSSVHIFNFQCLIHEIKTFVFVNLIAKHSQLHFTKS